MNSILPGADLILDDRHLSPQDFTQQYLRAASVLRSLGIGAGDSVALLLRNDLPFLLATMAIQHIGAYAVPINFHSSTREVSFVIGDCAARALIVHEDLLAPLGGALPQDLRVVSVRPSAALVEAFNLRAPVPAWQGPSDDWDELLAKAVATEAPPAPRTESIIYTSGTTGLPKGVKRHRSSEAEAAGSEQMRRQVLGIGSNAVCLVAAPLYHTAPNMYALRALRNGSRLIVLPRFSPIALLDAISRRSVTHLYAVATMFIRLLALPAEVRARYDLSSLQFVIHAGGPCPAHVKRAMLDWWGPVIYEYYGSTELGPVTCITPAEWMAHPGSVGRAVFGTEIKILDDDDQEVPPMQIGEVCAHSSVYPDFDYINRPGARAELSRGGFLASGDLGYLDEEGFIFLTDRKRDMIISGGVNIYPAEIERVLMEYMHVEDCAVFGVPDDDFGEAVMALVQPKDGVGLDLSEMKAYLKQRLAGYKVPRTIEIRPQLPREDSGKIKKRLLRDAYWTQRSI